MLNEPAVSRSTKTTLEFDKCLSFNLIFFVILDFLLFFNILIVLLKEYTNK